jgi:hypothetical protein
MTDRLALISGLDITVPLDDVTKIRIHQPTIKEIIESLGSENDFFIACSLLLFPKKTLQSMGKIDLSDHSDFDILLMILETDNPVIQRSAFSIKQMLSLVLPQSEITVNQGVLLVFQDKKEMIPVNDDGFKIISDVLTDVFCLNGSTEKEEEYNPSGPMAQEIVRKLKQRKKQLAEIHKKQQDGNKITLDRYISILAVGEQKSIRELLEYTIYQLYDEFHRFNLKQSYDTYIEIKLAGGGEKGDTIDNWMDDIHSNK